MMQQRSFDVVVLGAGPGGYVAAIRASQLGLKAAVVEKEIPGGVCLNIGCIPSKSLIHQATQYREGRALFELGGARVDLSDFDYSKIWKQSRLASERLSKGVRYLLGKNSVELVQGRGELVDANTVLVEGAGGKESLHAAAIVLATGSRPKSVPGFEIDEKRVISSTGFLMSETLPKSIIILGAGAIGMEFAYILDCFGVTVTIVELMRQVLPLEDEESARIVEKAFVSRGIAIHTEAKAEGVETAKAGVALRCALKDGSRQVLEAERLLVAIGRAPNTEGLGIEKLGILSKRGNIETNDYYETSVKGVYAIGDITTSPQLAHVASKAGEIAVEHIAHVLKGSGEPKERTVNVYAVPSAVYCDPEAASFGLSEKKAKDLGARYAIARFPYKGIGKAVATGCAEGQVKVVYAPDTGRILGASIVGAGATELIHELLLASKADLGLEDVAGMIHAHPTLSEGILEAARAGLGRAVHI